MKPDHDSTEMPAAAMTIELDLGALVGFDRVGAAHSDTANAVEQDLGRVLSKIGTECPI